MVPLGRRKRSLVERRGKENQERSKATPGPYTLHSLGLSREISMAEISQDGTSSDLSSASTSPSTSPRGSTSLREEYFEAILSSPRYIRPREAPDLHSIFLQHQQQQRQPHIHQSTQSGAVLTSSSSALLAPSSPRIDTGQSSSPTTVLPPRGRSPLSKRASPPSSPRTARELCRSSPSSPAAHRSRQGPAFSTCDEPVSPLSRQSSSRGGGGGAKLDKLLSKLKQATIGKSKSRIDTPVLPRSQSGEELDQRLAQQETPRKAALALREDHRPVPSLKLPIDSLADGHARESPRVDMWQSQESPLRPSIMMYSTSIEPNLLPVDSSTTSVKTSSVPTGPTNTSLAFESMFGELAIKIVFHPSSPVDASERAGQGTIPREKKTARRDISLLRVNERKLDFALVVHQLESMHQFSSRGQGMELWYIDKDGDALRITDTPGLVYACEDWRTQLQPGSKAPTEFNNKSMRIYVNDTFPAEGVST